MIRLKWSIFFTLLVSVGAALLLELDWRSHRPASPPRVEQVVRLSGPLFAGAAKIDLTPSQPTVVAGYVPPRQMAKSAGPLFARAVVLRSGGVAVGIISAELQWVPEPVARKVRDKARAMGLADVMITATHTHSSWGGYDSHPIAQYGATGWYHQALAQYLAAKLSEALETAQRSMKPAKLRSGLALLPGISKNRDDANGEVDPELTALTIDNENDEPMARLFVFGSHPTLVARGGDRLDGDWPGRAMALLEKKGGIAIFMQGAEGDVTSTPPIGEASAMDRMGNQVAQGVLTALRTAHPLDSKTIALARVEIELPPAQANHVVHRFLRRPAANILDLLSPKKATAMVFELGDAWLLSLPAEPTVAAAKALRRQVAERVSPQTHLVIVGLTQGYIGYLETPEKTEQGRGEAKRTLFGPRLQKRLGDGLLAGVAAINAR